MESRVKNLGKENKQTKESKKSTLARVPHLAECCPANKEVAVLVRAHVWVAGEVPGWGGVRGS